MFDTTAHIADAIARLPPCFTLSTAVFMKKINEDTLVLIVEKLSPIRKRWANEEDE